MLREMPYVEGMAAHLLREALAGDVPGDPLVVTEMPDRDVRTYPLVLVTGVNTAYEFGGLLARTTVDLQVWSATSRRHAAGVAEHARLALRAAHLTQARLADPIGDPGAPTGQGQAGHLVGFEVTSSGFLPSGDTEAPWRFQLLTSLAVRPSD